MQIVVIILININITVHRRIGYRFWLMWYW